MKKIIIILLAIINVYLIIYIMNVNKELRYFNTFINNLISARNCRQRNCGNKGTS
ncbi:MAG: hypothetical protein IJV31_09440 [Clostridia bacterium]|nr:hypothetical protein [Clostridia bacterium]